MTTRALSLSLFGLLALLGCADGKGSVTGTVTFDGQPVASGTVIFVKQDGELVREGAIIKDGSFQTLLAPGQYKIELNSQKVIGKRKQKAFDGSDEEVEITGELIPDQYNTQTTLSTKIDPGPNTVKLNVKSTR